MQTQLAATSLRADTPRPKTLSMSRIGKSGPGRESIARLGQIQ
jgi:hypothetical protein